MDTGAYSPIIPPSLAKSFQIEILAKTELALADERKVEAEVFLAYFKLMYREVDISDSRNGLPELMLGVTVFEGLGIRINPATGELGIFKAIWPLSYIKPLGRSIGGQKLLELAHKELIEYGAAILSAFLMLLSAASSSHSASP